MSLHDPKPKTEAEAYHQYIARSRTIREERPSDAASPSHEKPRDRRGVNAPPAGAPKEGVSAPRYRVDGEIARGGMAAILRVWDADLRRTLAMKVILADRDRVQDGSTADLRLSRFLGEAQITGQLDHPGVVPVHELGLDDNGRVYFTMRLVKGDNFGDVIEKVRNGTDGWNLTRAINVLHRVCETMAYAHAKGVVHRDLKPENLMVGRFGETYVMDWGVARLLDSPGGDTPRRESLSATASALIVRRDLTESQERTQAGAIMGTPCYMPPEQAAGELESIGPQSDVYSVGAILYQLLTGTRPYARAAAQSPIAVVRAVLEGPPTQVHRIERKVSPELAAICERAMARSPADRYPSMVQMAADLQAYLEGRVVHAYKTGAVAEFVKWVRRNRGISASLAGLVLVAIAGLVALAWTQGRRVDAIAEDQGRISAARDDALAELEKARQKGYLASVIAADASLSAGAAAEAKRYLGDCPEGLRGWEWNHLLLAADASIAVLDAQSGPISGLAMDATGDRLVAGVTYGAPRVYDLNTRRAAVALADDPSDSKPISAPTVAFLDGGLNVAAFGHQDERIRSWNAAAGSIANNLRLQTPALHAIAVHPLGTRVAIAVADNSIRIVELLTGVEMGRLTGHQGAVYAMTFSADGLQLVSGSEDRTVRIWDVAGTREVRAPIATARAVHSVAKSVDGELAVGLEDGSIWRYTADGEVRDQLSGHEGHVLGLDYDHEGARLASASADKTVRVWSTADGRPLAILVGHAQAVTHVQFAARGSMLASGSADGTVRLWEPDRNRAGVVHESRGDVPRAVDITRDGALVAVGSDRAVELVDAVTGRQTLVASGGPDQDAVVALQFAPDGEHLAVAFRAERSLRVCDVSSGKLGEAMRGHEAALTSIAWSPDGKTIASGSEDNEVRLWDAARRVAIGTPWQHPAAVTAVTFSCDSTRVAVGTRDGSVHVWEVSTNKRLHVIPSDSKVVHALAFAPTGGALAVGYHEGTIRVFEPDTTLARLTLPGHSRTVNALRYLPDGTRLVSGAADDTVRLWDAATGRLALTLRDHGKPVTSVAAGGSIARIVSASDDGTVRIRFAHNDPSSAR